jgi:hypothetical protein
MSPTIYRAAIELKDGEPRLEELAENEIRLSTLYGLVRSEKA